MFRQRALHCACHVAAPFPMLLGCSSEHTAGIFCGDSRGIASAHLLGVQCTAREIAAPAASRDGAPTSAGRTEHDTQALNDKTTVGAQLKHTTGKKKLIMRECAPGDPRNVSGDECWRVLLLAGAIAVAPHVAHILPGAPRWTPHARPRNAGCCIGCRGPNTLTTSSERLGK